MRIQLDRNLEESNEYRRKLDLSARDHKRLQDDLLTVTRENQVNISLSLSRERSSRSSLSRHFIRNWNTPSTTRRIFVYKFKITSKK